MRRRSSAIFFAFTTAAAVCCAAGYGSQQQFHAVKQQAEVYVTLPQAETAPTGEQTFPTDIEPVLIHTEAGMISPQTETEGLLPETELPLTETVGLPSEAGIVPSETGLLQPETERAQSETSLQPEEAGQTQPSETVSAEETSTVESALEETTSQENTSEKNASEENTSEEIASEENASEENTSEEIASEENASEENTSEKNTSEEITSDAETETNEAADCLVSEIEFVSGVTDFYADIDYCFTADWKLLIHFSDGSSRELVLDESDSYVTSEGETLLIGIYPTGEGAAVEEPFSVSDPLKSGVYRVVMLSREQDKEVFFRDIHVTALEEAALLSVGSGSYRVGCADRAYRKEFCRFEAIQSGVYALRVDAQCCVYYYENEELKQLMPDKGSECSFRFEAGQTYYIGVCRGEN